MDNATHLILRLQPCLNPQTVEVSVSAVCVNDVNEINPCEAVVIPMQMLRSLSPECAKLRIALAFPFLNAGSFILVDSRRMFAHLTAKSPIAQPPPPFISSCVICDVSFSSQEESEAHFGSEDHETAQFFSLSQLTRDLDTTALNSDNFPQFTAKTEVCKLCMGQFQDREYLLAHIRREHERDSIDLLDRTDLLARRRTLD
ncbi:unnamed protein product [Gongylonema pulchrum]|uniref:C2H2-type domain-containing protein n=1 Tax=Gongylonema pulchrum TaxID=637853 RepID=A0A3P7RHY8_9BILA|nr:unnamed protein product [Gongylonema pulchrum]